MYVWLDEEDGKNTLGIQSSEIKFLRHQKNDGVVHDSLKER